MANAAPASAANGSARVRRSRWRPWLITAGLTGLALLIGYATAWWLASARVARVEAALVADGAPNDVASLLGPAPAAADDGGREWAEAVAGLPTDLPGYELATRDGLARAALDPASAKALCARHQQRLELFARGAAKPTVRLPIHWTDEDLRLPHLTTVRFLARLTLVRGAAAWGEDPQRGGPAALAAIATVRAAAQRLGEEPTLISNLVASAIEGEALHLLWLISRDPAVVTCDLTSLRAALAQPSPINAGLKRALDGERILFGRRIFHAQDSYGFVANQVQGTDRAIQQACWWLYKSWPLAPLRLHDEAYYLEMMRRWRVRLGPDTGQPLVEDVADETRPDWYPVSKLVLPRMEGILASRATTDLERRLALAAIDSIVASRANGRLTPAANLPPGITAELSAGGLKLQGAVGTLRSRRWPMGPDALKPPPALPTAHPATPPEPSGTTDF